MEKSSEERDADFVRAPDEWPVWPLLPVKRRSKSPLDVDHFTGFLLAERAPPYKVYLGSIYAIRGAKTWAEATTGMLAEEFASLDQLIKEWKVD
jgi:hypothetical protein